MEAVPNFHNVVCTTRSLRNKKRPPTRVDGLILLSKKFFSFSRFGKPVSVFELETLMGSCQAQP